MLAVVKENVMLGSGTFVIPFETNCCHLSFACNELHIVNTPETLVCVAGVVSSSGKTRLYFNTLWFNWWFEHVDWVISDLKLHHWKICIVVSPCTTSGHPILEGLYPAAEKLGSISIHQGSLGDLNILIGSSLIGNFPTGIFYIGLVWLWK